MLKTRWKQFVYSNKRLFLYFRKTWFLYVGDIDSHPYCRRADRWHKTNHMLQGEQKADLSLNYAQGKYKEFKEAADRLDSKADALLKLTGGAAFAFTIAMNVIEKYETNWVWCPVVLFAISAIASLLCRAPTDMSQPPRVDHVLSLLQKRPIEEVKGSLPSTYHIAIESLRVVTERKAAYVNWATQFFTAAIFALILVLMLSAPGKDQCEPGPAQQDTEENLNDEIENSREKERKEG